MIEPYYSDDRVTIYHGDCRDVLPELAGDALVTDPPYGVGLKTKRARNKGGGSHAVNPASVVYDDDTDEVAQLIRDAIPTALEACGGRGLVFCGFKMLHEYPRPVVIGSVHLPAGCGFTPWGFQTSQPILYYGADPYLANGLGHRPNGFTGRGLAGEFDHPCPKPIQWMNWAVTRASMDGETVLDPFMGTGTTLVAAKWLGRRAIGIELEERYCEIAVKRLAQEVLDLGA